MYLQYTSIFAFTCELFTQDKRHTLCLLIFTCNYKDIVEREMQVQVCLHFNFRNIILDAYRICMICINYLRLYHSFSSRFFFFCICGHVCIKKSLSTQLQKQQLYMYMYNRYRYICLFTSHFCTYNDIFTQLKHISCTEPFFKNYERRLYIML